MLWFVSCAILVVALFACCFDSSAMDIAVYMDPLSYWNVRYLIHNRWDGYNAGYHQFVQDSMGNLNDWMADVYGWYREMNVNKVMVIYPDSVPWAFSQVPSSLPQVQVMNYYYAGVDSFWGFRYADAQYRDVQVGHTQPDPAGYWSYETSIGDDAEREQVGGPPWFSEARPVVAIGPGINYGNGSPDTLWRATSYLGRFSGWDRLMTGWLDGC